MAESSYKTYKKCTESQNGIKKQEQEEAAVVEKEINHDNG